MFNILTGNKKFFMGEDPSEVDCAIFGMVAQIRWHMEGSLHETLLQGTPIFYSFKENVPSYLCHEFFIRNLSFSITN